MLAEGNAPPVVTVAGGADRPHDQRHAARGCATSGWAAWRATRWWPPPPTTCPRRWAATSGCRASGPTPGPIDGYKTSLMVLVDQLELLAATMDKILDAANRADAQALHRARHVPRGQVRAPADGGPDLTSGAADMTDAARRDLEEHDVSTTPGHRPRRPGAGRRRRGRRPGRRPPRGRGAGRRRSPSRSTGAFVDWCVGDRRRPTSAEDFFDAASRGRRYRSAPTPR